MNAIKYSLVLAVVIFGISCEKDKLVQEGIKVPANYEFTRNGQSSVSYSGQLERLNQLEEMKLYLQKGDQGELLLEIDLLGMYENTGGDGNGNFSFSSTKQLKNKTFSLDQSTFETILKEAATASVNGNSGVVATNGTSGLILRSNSKTILVNKNGFEFTQLFEKGIMGGTFFYQIVNNYLTDEKIGSQADNTFIDPDKNYSEMEHHWDEAFGYFGAPIDFKSNYTGSDKVRFWAKYSNALDAALNTNNNLMYANKEGRAAIVANLHDIKNSDVDLINLELQEIIAATAIHYAKEAKSATNQGDVLHVLTECYAFTKALKYCNPNYRLLSPTEVDTLLTNSFNGNLWDVTQSDLDSLMTILAETYNLQSVLNQL